MPVHKVTQFLSDISTFFKKSDSDHAMFAIMDVIKGIRINLTSLLIFAYYIDVKWRVRNSRNLNYLKPVNVEIVIFSMLRVHLEFTSPQISSHSGYIFHAQAYLPAGGPEGRREERL